MGSTGYRLLGYAVWRGGKWYLRKRVPRPRTIAIAAGASAAAAVGAAVIARRLAS